MDGGLKSPTLGALVGLQSPRTKQVSLGEKTTEKPSPFQPHFFVPSDDKMAKDKLPPIDASSVVSCRHEKKGYGDLIVEGGEVILDFWRRKLKMTIKRECILVEQTDCKRQMFAREDLPKKYHSLYLFAAKMVDALKQKQLVQSKAPLEDFRESQARVGPEEISEALHQRSRITVVPQGASKLLAASSVLKASSTAQKASLRLTTSRS
jgi:hypothetical protein